MHTSTRYSRFERGRRTARGIYTRLKKGQRPGGVGKKDVELEPGRKVLADEFHGTKRGAQSVSR